MKLRYAVMIALVFAAGAVMAYGQPYQPVHPTQPTYDGFVKTGGKYHGNFHNYFVGLRGGFNAQPRQDYEMRYRLSDQSYPQGYKYEAKNIRPGYRRTARIGGYNPNYRRYDKGQRGYANRDVI